MICKLEGREFYIDDDGSCHWCGTLWLSHPGNLWTPTKEKFYEHLRQQYLEDQKHETNRNAVR